MASSRAYRLSSLASCQQQLQPQIALTSTVLARPGSKIHHSCCHPLVLLKAVRQQSKTIMAGRGRGHARVFHLHLVAAGSEEAVSICRHCSNPESLSGQGVSQIIQPLLLHLLHLAVRSLRVHTPFPEPPDTSLTSAMGPLLEL